MQDQAPGKRGEDVRRDAATYGREGGTMGHTLELVAKGLKVGSSRGINGMGTRKIEVDIKRKKNKKQWGLTLFRRTGGGEGGGGEKVQMQWGGGGSRGVSNDDRSRSTSEYGGGGGGGGKHIS